MVPIEVFSHFLDFATLAFNESIIFAEIFVLDVWLGFEYGSENSKAFNRTYLRMF